MLTDSTYKKNAAVKAEEREQLRRKRMALVAKRALESDSLKIETIKAFLAFGGNVALTATAMDLSRMTVHRWKNSAWWNRIITELRKEEKLVLSSKTKSILNTAMEGLADRVANGDHIYDQKKGQLVRKPLVAKDLHKITTDLMDRADILDKQTVDNDLVQNDDDKLAKLAERFANLAVKAAERSVNKDTGVVVDVPYVERNVEAKEI